MQTKRITNGLMALVSVQILVVLLICMMPNELENVYRHVYIVNLLCLVISIILLIKLYLKNRLDIFEPIVLISMIYITMYFFTPIYDIYIGELMWYGYDLFQYGIKATFIEFIGFLVFFICYQKKFKLISYDKYKVLKNKKNDRLKISIILILIMYLFCFLANAFYLMKYNGNGLLYILTLGMFGGGGTVQTTEASIGFISMFSYSLPTITLLYWEFGKSKILKVILFVPMLMLQVARGFRFFILQIAITFFAYYYIKNKKRPKFADIFITFLILMIPILLMTLFRDSIRGGKGIDISTLDISTVRYAFEAAVWDNFRIYQNFYGMVNVIPSQYPYVFGRQMILGTIFMVIPRIVWPGKISSYGGYGLSTLIGSRIAGGQAYPNVGEYYYAGGIIGVILCMGLYGMWMRRVKNKFMYSKNPLDVIKYSILLGVNLQLIIRGYTPSNFWYVFFAILPIWIIRHFGIKREKIYGK